MSFKLPLTEDFLWGLYNFVEEIGKIHDFFAPRSFGAAFNPDLYRFQKYYARQRDRKKFAKLVFYLKRKNYIKIKDLENSKAIILTSKGKQKILRIKRRVAGNIKKKRKDGRWQMVIFDIPEKERENRESLRNGLKDMGYEKLQRSIWICPYDVFRETQDLIRDCSVEQYAKLLLVEEIKSE